MRRVEGKWAKFINPSILIKFMLTRILDTTKINMNDSEIRAELNMDLRRMDCMEHEEMPEGSDVYLLEVSPSIQTYRPGFHRFRFKIQYGNLIDGEIRIKGKSKHTQSEALPII